MPVLNPQTKVLGDRSKCLQFPFSLQITLSLLPYLHTFERVLTSACWTWWLVICRRQRWNRGYFLVVQRLPFPFRNLYCDETGQTLLNLRSRKCWEFALNSNGRRRYRVGHGASRAQLTFHALNIIIMATNRCRSGDRWVWVPFTNSNRSTAIVTPVSTIMLSLARIP